METITTLSLLSQLPSINETIGLFYNTMEKVISHRNSYFIKRKLYELDLSPTINNIELLIKKEEESIKQNEVLFLCTERIKQTIHSVHKILENIQYKLEIYDKSWISWIIGINLSYELDDLKINKNILEQRIDNFIKMYLFVKKINT